MSILFAFLIAWAVLIFSLKLIDVLNEGALSRALQRRNITLKFGYFSFQTTQLNAAIDRFAQRHRRRLVFWFDIGVALGLCGLLLSLALLSLNIVQTIGASQPSRAEPVFKPRPRVPLTSDRPWWLPRYYWTLLSAADHHPSAIVPRTDQPDLLTAAWKHDIDPAALLQFIPPGEEDPPRKLKPGGRRGCGKRREDFFDEVGRLYDQSAWVAKRRRRRRRRRPRRPRRHSPRHPYWGPPDHARFRDDSDGGDNLPDGLHADLAGIDAFHAQSSRARDGSDSRDKPPFPDTHDAPPRHLRLRRRIRRRRLFTLDEESNNTSIAERGDAAPAAQRPRRFLTPLVPGVTVPAGDVWYMLATVLVAGAVHELGHAIAAAAQNAEVASVGAFVALLMPGAFVKLCGIDMLPPRAQLRVHCAGAWHNLASAGLALLTVRFLSTLAAPAYVTGNGALVVGVSPVSPLANRVLVGDLVRQLGGRPVRDGGMSFRSAVDSLVKTGDSVGFCVSDAAVRPAATGLNASDDAACCNGNKEDCYRKQGLNRTHACIDAKLISPTHICRLSMDCTGGDVIAAASARAVDAGLMPATGTGSGDEKPKPGRDSVGCYIPHFEKGWQLVDVQVRSGQSGQMAHYLFEGPPHILGQSVTVSSYVPRMWDHVPWGILQVIASADTPNVVERFLQYMASISLGLAILNMAPVLFLDGAESSGLFVKCLLPKVKDREAKRISAATVLLGSGLMTVNLVLSLFGLDQG